MTQRSKSTLFLIEQLIVIAVFAICAAACISILTAAYFYTIDSRATDNAIVKAESMAETFKAVGTDFTAIADILGGETTSVGLGTAGVSVVAVYYDSAWQISSKPYASYGAYLLIESTAAHTTDTSNGTVFIDVITGRVIVERITGEELVSLTVAIRNS